MSKTDIKAQKVLLASLPLRPSQGHQRGPNWCIEILMVSHLPETQNLHNPMAKMLLGYALRKTGSHETVKLPRITGLNTPKGRIEKIKQGLRSQLRARALPQHAVNQ